MNPIPSKEKVDPVTLQVLSNAIYSVADEMVAALVRTSFSTNIKDRRDCSAGVFTKDLELIAQGEVGTPLHVGVMLPAVGTALKSIPFEDLEPGDDIIMNTPYPEGPGHLNDVTLVSPVFFENEIVAFVANMAHHVDVGGFAPGSMPFGVWEHFQEGLQIPPVKIVRKNKLNEEILSLIIRNVRAPVEFRGDLTAQIAANNVGENRLQHLMNKYTQPTVQFYMEQIMDYSERRILSAIRSTPRGSHEFEDFLEGDGLSTDHVRIHGRITVEESKIVADFSESDAQVLGPLNCRPPSVKACVYYVVKALLDPGLPPNSGAFRPIEVITRPGTLLEANFPAALCNANIVTTQRVVDVLLGAFVNFLPERVSAACSGTMNLLNIGGRKSREDSSLFNYIETYGGGQGAMHDRDGASGIQTHMTNTRNAPVEALESAYPLLIHGYGLVPESAGAGKFRGGFGIRREIEIQTTETTITLSSDRFEVRPWGVLGGESGKPAACFIHHRDGGEERLLSKVSRRIQERDRLISVTPGGGGWGSPYERDPEAVRRDVVEELISRTTAEEVYGVVLTSDLTVDQEATHQLRNESMPRTE